MISNPVAWPNGARVAFCHADDPQAADNEAKINAITDGFGNTLGPFWSTRGDRLYNCLFGGS